MAMDVARLVLWKLGFCVQEQCPQLVLKSVEIQTLLDLKNAMMETLSLMMDAPPVF